LWTRECKPILAGADTYLAKKYDPTTQTYFSPPDKSSTILGREVVMIVPSIDASTAVIERQAIMDQNLQSF
jgi:hypothetical protein